MPEIKTISMGTTAQTSYAPVNENQDIYSWLRTECRIYQSGPPQLRSRSHILAGLQHWSCCMGPVALLGLTVFCRFRGSIGGLAAPKLSWKLFYRSPPRFLFQIKDCLHKASSWRTDFSRTTSMHWHSTTVRASRDLRSRVHLCVPFPVIYAVETSWLCPAIKRQRCPYAQRHHPHALCNNAGERTAAPACTPAGTLPCHARCGNPPPRALCNNAGECTAVLAGTPAVFPVTHVMGIRWSRAPDEAATPSRPTAAPPRRCATTRAFLTLCLRGGRRSETQQHHPDGLRNNTLVRKPVLAGMHARFTICANPGVAHPNEAVGR
ncbi:hypothetical protein GGX14DRAFT_674584 [Mycena pura]|uniref:Uncharacterized protein n=1 Tax=Mycena pura TaxID=153505 RepID=A0AAD6UVT4_9AGAR|nr:hypothetical protein GGX14DRAFT_674584 [Mycena pura]